MEKMSTWLLPGAKEKKSYCPEEKPCHFCRTVKDHGFDGTPEEKWKWIIEENTIIVCLESPEYFFKRIDLYKDFHEKVIISVEKIWPGEAPLDVLKTLEEWGKVLLLCAEFKQVVTKLKSVDDSYIRSNDDVDSWGENSNDSDGDYLDSKDDRRESFNEMNYFQKMAEQKKEEINEAMAKTAGYVDESKTQKKRKRLSLESFLKKKPAYVGTVLRRCKIFSADDIVKMPKKVWVECKQWIAPFIYDELNAEYRS